MKQSPLLFPWTLRSNKTLVCVDVYVRLCDWYLVPEELWPGFRWRLLQRVGVVRPGRRRKPFLVINVVRDLSCLGFISLHWRFPAQRAEDGLAKENSCSFFPRVAAVCVMTSLLGWHSGVVVSAVASGQGGCKFHCQICGAFVCGVHLFCFICFPTE